jgi:predicted RNase H-like HicB family nuclease
MRTLKYRIVLKKDPEEDVYVAISPGVPSFWKDRRRGD